MISGRRCYNLNIYCIVIFLFDWWFSLTMRCKKTQLRHDWQASPSNDWMGANRETINCRMNKKIFISNFGETTQYKSIKEYYVWIIKVYVNKQVGGNIHLFAPTLYSCLRFTTLLVAVIQNLCATNPPTVKSNCRQLWQLSSFYIQPATI